MTPSYLDGVLAQPANLARSAVAVRRALAGPAGAAALAVLRSGRIAVLGMGASAAAAAGFAVAMRSAGWATVAVSTAELGAGTPALADAYLAISQSGRSAETVEALAAFGPGGRIGLTNAPASPLAAVSDVVLPLGCAEDSRVSTLSYTATLQALGLLLDALAGGGEAGLWDALPDLATAVLATEANGAAIAAAFADVSTVDVVGGGIRVASAGAAALLLREAAHLPAAGYATREYLHGHLEVAGPGRGALLFGAGREVPLAADLAGWGAAVVLVTDAPGELPTHPNLRVVRLPAPSGSAGPGGSAGLAGCVLDILPVQRAAYLLAERSGQPIELRHMPADTKISTSASPIS